MNVRDVGLANNDGPLTTKATKREVPCAPAAFTVNAQLYVPGLRPDGLAETAKDPGVVPPLPETLSHEQLAGVAEIVYVTPWLLVTETC